MNKKQIKDLHSVLKSIELNEMVLSNIQQSVEKEKFILEERRDNYENKGTDYWDDKASELDDKIDILEDEVNDLEELSSSLQELIELMRDKVGTIEGNAIQTPYINQRKSYPTQAMQDYTKRDPLFEEVARLVVSTNTASTASLQRRYSIGYNRAGVIMDQLEAAGIVGPSKGGKPRGVLVDAITLESILQD